MSAVWHPWSGVYPALSRHLAAVLITISLLSGTNDVFFGQTGVPRIGVSSQSVPDICAMAPLSRVDCGYPGISEKRCESYGCCFDRSIRDVNWCFNKGCGRNPSDREDCGFIGISRLECEDRNCCYDDTIPSTIWCFYDNSTCVMSVESREDCGHPGISPQTCIDRGCCWNQEVRDVPWCFRRKDMPSE